MRRSDRRTIFHIICTFLLAVTILLSSSCAKRESGHITVGYQFGVAYAPLLIMKEHAMLEKRLPDTEITWEQFGSPVPIREGMLNGSVTFGFMGISPVLIGIDHGMPWRYAAGLSVNRVAIVVNRPEIRTLADFKENERIAVLSPGCTQHVLLSLLASRQLGDAAFFDTRIVSMTHPDACNALLAETEIAAHVATSPYIEEELEAGCVILADGEEILGEPFTFISCVAMEEYVETSRKEYDFFLEALQEAVDYINEDMERAAAELAPLYGIDADALLSQMLYRGESIYDTKLTGIGAMSNAMEEAGFIGKALPPDQLVFPE